jgi:hypothetical protein
MRDYFAYHISEFQEKFGTSIPEEKEGTEEALVKIWLPWLLPSSPSIWLLKYGSGGEFRGYGVWVFGVLRSFGVMEWTAGELKSYNSSGTPKYSKREQMPVLPSTPQK